MAQLKRRGRSKEEISEAEEKSGEAPSEETPARRRGKGKGTDAAPKEPGMDSSVIYRSGEMPRLHGKGISFRLAMSISFLLAPVLVVFGIVTYLRQSSSLDGQIDSGGVEAVRALAMADPECWSTTHGLSAAAAEAEAKDGGPKANLTEEEKARRAANLRRLVPLVQGENTQILLAQITTGGKVIRSSKTETYEYSFKPASRERSGEVTIAYGTCFLNKNAYSARLYSCPIKNPAGDAAATAEIVLSEAQIEASRFRLLLTMALLIAVFIGVGIAGAFWMGKRIAMPVKALIEDVSVVAGGDLEHHTVPKSQDEIGLLARTFDKMTKNLLEARGKEMELAAQRHQLAVAQEVQAKLLPEVIPQVEGYEIEAFHRSSRDMGGNYYDVFRFPNGKIGALVASASGKGIPAALVMTMARSFMRALTHLGDDLGGMVRECNRLLSPDLRAGMYVELLVVVLDPVKHRARFVSAGPTMLLRYDCANQKLLAVQADGIAMGFDKGPVFDKTLKEAECELHHGDRLVLSGQGLFTIKGAGGEELGGKGFARLVVKHATADSASFVHRLVNNLGSFAGGEVKDSDVTFITIRRKPA